MASEEDLRVATTVVRQCVDSAKRVDCDCEDLWCYHWEAKVAASFSTALSKARAEQREVDAKIAEQDSVLSWVGGSTGSAKDTANNIARAIRAGKE